MTPRTLLITGATSGIGRHAALHLARRGHKVFATGRNESALIALESEGAGTGLEALPLDVTDSDSIAAAERAIESATDGAGIDVLINNAGFGIAAPMAEISDADIRAQFDTNVFGLMAVTRAFLGQLERRGGRIVNVSSVGGRITLPFFGAYNATKHALESMSDALRLELAALGIRVVLIEPGVIRTDFGNRSIADVDKYRTADSIYGPLLQDAEDFRDKTERMGVGPLTVSRAIERAITSRRPRARYIAPTSAKLLLLLARILPTSWVDAVLRRATGLTRKRLAGVSARGELQRA